MGKNRLLINLPWIPLGLSKFWVRLFSGASKDLVYPLIDSLRHKMVKKAQHAIPSEWNIELASLEQMIDATFQTPFIIKDKQKQQVIKQRSEVRSIQRFVIKPEMNARAASEDYFSWLPASLRYLIRVDGQDGRYHYRLRLFGLLLISLSRLEKASDEHRQVFAINDGILVHPENQGRFEFRQGRGGGVILIALHNFKPALPWIIYRYSQAILHQWVMNRFARERLAN